jgi:hypothetical protein
MKILAITILLVLIVWIFVRPDQAMHVVMEAKRRLRLQIIDRAGRQGAKDLHQQLQEWAIQQGHDPDLVDAVLSDNETEIIQSLGHKEANAILGESTLFEQFY